MTARARARRVSRQTDSSLDLLLDTICNMFGIFIFSAMIVAVLSMTRSTVVTQVKARSDHDRRARALQAQVVRLREEVAELEGSAATQLAEKVAKSKRTRAVLQTAILQKQARLEQDFRRAHTEEEQVSDLVQRVPSMQQEQESLLRAIEAAAAIKDVTIRSPRERPLDGRTPVQIVVDQEKVFVLNPLWDLKGAHECDVWTSWNAADVVPERSRYEVLQCVGSNVHIRRSVALRPDGGCAATDALELQSNPAWSRFLSALDPARHVVSIQTTPTGHVAFGFVRNAIVGTGVPYQANAQLLKPGLVYEDEIVNGTPRGQ